MKNFINNFFSRPPVIFPLVACFLLFLTFNEAQLFLLSEDTAAIFKVRPILMAMMTVFWIGATLFHKWGALGFLILTAVTVGIYFFMPGSEFKQLLGNVLMLRIPYDGKVFPIPMSIIFSFAILYYFRKME
ncbi:hypothetical protein DBR32_08070 [Taibaiella sp. KBW10]|uniref:hypothetical protein n=1 Tax=Taibaiella sp. KBW10 TaxID=2153357 RepID=UPI000F595343|nr:hypothetical protein [Taibaiella sp. KBW10]RQO30678.1 hypothetical protein DBR32_08070 [Taibaiella sp. KBW10]